MTNQINNLNKVSTMIDILQTVEINKIEKHLNKSKNSKLLVLNLDDLNVDIINQLKEKQCGMFLLNENCRIVEDTKSNQIHHIPITIDGCKQPIVIENIIRFEACGNYTYIHLKNKTKLILTSRTLKHYVDLVGEENFIRPHHKHLVNLQHISEFNNKSIELKDGTSITVSRRKVAYVKKILRAHR